MALPGTARLMTVFPKSPLRSQAPGGTVRASWASGIRTIDPQLRPDHEGCFGQAGPLRDLYEGLYRAWAQPPPPLNIAQIPKFNELGHQIIPRAVGGHSSHLRGNFCSASKLSAALWSKTAARCFAFSSGHTSTVDSVPFGAIRTTCHPRDLASYRSRFMLRI